MSPAHFSWWSVARLGLVQTALGSIVVIATSTLNRVMVVEWALPAMLPGALVAWHYAVQISRPRFGFSSDRGGNRANWIIGGMLLLAAGGVLSSFAVAVMGTSVGWGIALAAVGFSAIGAGVGCAGTSLLALLAIRVAENRRAAAATIVWLMMIAGFAVTATVAGQFLDPFSPSRLVIVSSVISAAAIFVTVGALFRLDGRVERQTRTDDQPNVRFGAALASVWRESLARRFAIFVLVAMFAYSAQDLILEPFAGTVFALTPGETTSLAGIQHTGVLLGMILVAVVCGIGSRGRQRDLRIWAVGGCIASALALGLLALSGFVSTSWPLTGNILFLGLANGAFAVAAIGSMMALAGEGEKNREGTRMGVWGAAQALGFGLGGFAGTVAIDSTRALFGDPTIAYAAVFSLEAAVFMLAATLMPRSPAPTPLQEPASQGAV